MKAITLWQPWASAIAVDSKRVETRGWPIRYRGDIAIHAAQVVNRGMLIQAHSSWNWQGAMRPLGWKFGASEWERLPFGAIVAIARVVDCRPTDSFTQAELDTRRRPAGEVSDIYDWTERQMGNFDLGRFGWVLDNIRRLPEPIVCTGRQGIWTVKPSIAAAAMEQLEPVTP